MNAYLRQCEEIKLTKMNGSDFRVNYLINLKKDPDSKYFFKLVELSSGKRSNIFLSAEKDTEMLISVLKNKAAKSLEGEVFASWTSEMFHRQTISIQRIKNDVHITSEDLKTDKSKKIVLLIPDINRLVECLVSQLKTVKSS